jgi:hypothetical protein
LAHWSFSNFIQKSSPEIAPKMSTENANETPLQATAPEAAAPAEPTSAPSDNNEQSGSSRGGRGQGRGRGGTANGRKHKNMGRKEYQLVLPPPIYEMVN